MAFFRKKAISYWVQIVTHEIHITCASVFAESNHIKYQKFFKKNTDIGEPIAIVEF